MKKRKLKQQPYYEIIKLDKELKEYKKLCIGKYKEFTYYTDWKEHISEELKKMTDDKMKENFKHYLINHKRVNKSLCTNFVPAVIFGYTLMFTFEFNNQDTINFEPNFVESLLSALDIVFWILMIIAILFFILRENNNINQDYYFYCDVLKIFEEIEERTENHAVTI